MDDRIIHAQFAILFLAAFRCAFEVFAIGRPQGKMAGSVLVKKCAFEEDTGIADGGIIRH